LPYISAPRSRKYTSAHLNHTPNNCPCVDSLPRCMQAQTAMAHDHFAEQRFMCSVRNLKCQKESLLIFLQLAAQQRLISPLPFVHPGDEVVRVNACMCVQVCVCACISSDTHRLARAHTGACVHILRERARISDTAALRSRDSWVGPALSSTKAVGSASKRGSRFEINCLDWISRLPNPG